MTTSGQNIISWFFQKLIFSQNWIVMITLYSVSKLDTNRSIRSPLKMQFINIKHIKIRRYLFQFLGSPGHSTNWSYEVLTWSHQYCPMHSPSFHFLIIFNFFVLVDPALLSAIFVGLPIVWCHITPLWTLVDGRTVGRAPELCSSPIIFLTGGDCRRGYLI